MKTLFILLSVMISTSAFAGGDSVSGTFLLQAQSLLSPNQFGSPLVDAADKLAGNQFNFSNDILDAYNPSVAGRILEAAPEFGANTEALAKYAAGISYLEKIEAVDPIKAVEQISNNPYFIKNYKTLDLQDIFEAQHF